jgi:hypothetical protein
MRIKPLPFEHCEEDPFRNDLLGRKEHAELLTDILASYSEPLVMSIDSDWGTGKTTFVKMWGQHLRNNGYKVIYFSAWENDFSDDAMVTLLGELSSQLRALNPSIADNQLNIALDKTIKIGSKLIKRATPIAIRIATAGILKGDEFTEEALADLTEQVSRDVIEQYENSKSAMREFHLAVQEVVENLDDGEEHKKPLVICIDELDRCRPDYAIKLIEIAKHVFNVEGLCFVLVLNKQVICDALSHKYGGKVDYSQYLQRIFDVEFKLPLPHNSQRFFDALWNSYDFDRIFEKRIEEGSNQGVGDRDELRRFLEKARLVFSLSLREEERVLSRVALALRATPPRSNPMVSLTSLLIVLKIVEPQLYEGFINGSISDKDVCKVIKEYQESAARSTGRTVFPESSWLWIEVDLYSMYSSRFSDAIQHDMLSERMGDLSMPMLSRRESYSTEIQGWFNRRFDLYRYMVRRIELLESLG